MSNLRAITAEERVVMRRFWSGMLASVMKVGYTLNPLGVLFLKGTNDVDVQVRYSVSSTVSISLI
uniref:hypothetical protein n=1 Tax=Raoultella ornithinolytica TaxID=54291 RepID=UPI0019676318